MENRRLFVLFISVFFGCVSLMAEKSELHQRAEADCTSVLLKVMWQKVRWKTVLHVV